MQLYMDETLRIFVLRQMKSVESMIIKEVHPDSAEYKLSVHRKELIDEKITQVFEKAEERKHR